ncbi:Peroxyureidoacrylate/ureidoacrylate amidohydrolase RutB [Variovorax sp. PBL-H6]|uniref:cysteine hydrolase family protein n=1 Tax=Variovorax sp. PBL-H6 TaxID=434009 RepID=UPI00131747CF|nr:isochorismatase family cysteine hydrolase [Variovorax sp. PBL-H6]VTU26696.1 Peroxyureidoacrylate/ureidoacrylate amidohydrolase RutB [Variovorax sp. PBL-H6]
MPDDVFSSVRHEQSITLAPRRTALLVVDMLNEFCKPGGLMVLPGYERLVPPQRSLIAAARAQGVPIFWVIQCHDPRLRRDRELLKRGTHCLVGSWGAEVIDDLDARPEDFRVFKHRYSAFFRTDLDLMLKDMQCDQLVVTGVVTNICVRSTVHDAFFEGYEVVVPQDCCAATSEREQNSSLYDIATHFGVVSRSDLVIDSLAQGKALTNLEGIA